MVAEYIRNSYEVENDFVAGTSLKGYTDAISFDEDGDEDWDYVKATIYNWKTGGVPQDEYEWHIGGTGWDAVEFIETIIKEQIKPEYNWND